MVLEVEIPQLLVLMRKHLFLDFAVATCFIQLEQTDKANGNSYLDSVKKFL